MWVYSNFWQHELILLDSIFVLKVYSIFDSFEKGMECKDENSHSYSEYAFRFYYYQKNLVEQFKYVYR